MEALVDEVLSSDRVKKKQGLEKLLSEVKSSRGHVTISNLTRFFIALQDALGNSETEIVLNALMVLQEIIPVNFN
jgi:hypothetical protein